MIVPLLATCECRGETLHELAGENAIGRPVWRCVECEATRVGPALRSASEAISP